MCNKLAGLSQACGRCASSAGSMSSVRAALSRCYHAGCMAASEQFFTSGRIPARPHTHHPVPAHKHHSTPQEPLTLCQMAAQTAYRGWRREDEHDQLPLWDAKDQQPWWQVAVACFLALQVTLAVTRACAFCIGA